MSGESSRENILVGVRVRPLNERELSSNNTVSWKLNLSSNSITHISNYQQRFNFDYLFDPQTKNDIIYEKVGKRLIDGVIKGINGTIFAYGSVR